MNIDSINLRDNILSDKLTKLLEGLNEALFDPFMIVNFTVILNSILNLYMYINI